MDGGDLGGACWPEVAAFGVTEVPAVVAIPVGSCEQHGPHLPLDTDTRVAVHVARRLAESDPAVMAAPAVAYGASAEHAGFPGTVWVDHETLARLLTALVRSARATFAGVVLVSAHGGNVEALGQVASRARDEGDHLLVVSVEVPGGDAHAGFTETSMMLALAPDLVRMDLAAPGRPEPLTALMPELRARGVQAVSPSGVLGDPRGADSGIGARILDEVVARALGDVAAWRSGLVPPSPALGG